MAEAAVEEIQRDLNEYVVFQLGKEYYAVDVDQVRDIRRMEEITEVPHAPMFVEGIINYRGSVMPVVDLRKRLDLSLAEHTKNTRIMVVRMERHTIGMIVDGVSEVTEIPGNTIEPPSPILLDVDSDFLKGIARVENDKGNSERLVVVLDLYKILSIESQEALDEFSETLSDGGGEV